MDYRRLLAPDPSPDAAAQQAAAHLEAALLPLFVYCEQTQAKGTDMSPWAFRHVRHLQAVFAAVQAYDETTKVLLTQQARAAEHVARCYDPLRPDPGARPPGPPLPPAPDRWPGGRCPPGLEAEQLLLHIPQMACFQNGLARLAAAAPKS